MRSGPAAIVLVAALTLGCSASGPLRVPAGTPALVPGSAGNPAARTITWPGRGQASYALDGRLRSSSGQVAAPIASVAKVMTAYLAVRRLSPDARVVVDAADVADTARRSRRGESVVRLVQGEVLTRDQALIA